MRRWQRTLTAALSAALVLSLCPTALAAEPDGKEEVVYINLEPDGQVKDVEVVNIFELDQPGEIVDYGPYSAVRNMTTTDPIELSGDKVTIQAGAGRLYYEGELPDAAIPWDIDIRYLLDGEPISADDLAGRSGALEIRLTVREDPACPGDFFGAYALQASLTLDGDRCRDIQAPGATAANVGSDKQLTYTILPGKGADISVKAQVTDFAMDPIAINGVPLSLDVQVDDEELMSQVTELLDAIAELDEGAQELDTGVGQLESSVSEDLLSGTGQLAQGAASLQSGAGKLKSGGSEVNAGAGSVSAGAGSVSAGAASVSAGAGTVSAGAGSVSAGASALDAGVQEMNGGLASLQAGLDTLAGKSTELTEGSGEVLSALRQVQTAVDGVELTDGDLTRIKTALDGAKSRVDGMIAELDAVTSAVAALEGIQQSYVSLAGALETAINGLDVPSSPPGAGAPGEGEGKSPTVPLQPDVTALVAVLDSLRQNNDAFSAALGQITALSGTAGTLRMELSLASGAIALLAGHVDTLPDALGKARGDVDTLVEQYATLDAGIRAYTQGVSDAAAGAATLTAGGAALAQGSATLVQGSTTLAQGSATLAQGSATLAQGSAALAAGAGDLYNGTASLLAGIVSIYDATGTLSDGAGALDSGVAELLAGVAQLREGSGQMADGTGQMAEKTDGMDKTIADKIDELLKSVTGGDGQIVSFASARNEDVSAVQFVIRTPPIQKAPEAAPEPTPEPEETAWDKLKDLFEK